MEHAGRIGMVRSSGRAARLVSGVVSLVFVLAACSSSDAGPAPEPPVTDSSPPETAEAPESTTTSTTSTSTISTTTEPRPVVDTEASESSEPAPDTTVSELPAPTSTMFDPSTPSGEVEQATLANLVSFFECAMELPDCDAVATMRFAALEFRDANIALIERTNAAGHEIRNGQDYTAAVESIEFGDDGLEAIVTTCVWDGTQVVSPATDSAEETVIDAGNVSRRDLYLVRLLGDSWLVTAKETGERAEGRESNLCD